MRRREMPNQCPSFDKYCSLYEFYIALLVAILFGHMRSSEKQAERNIEALEALKFFALVFFGMTLKGRGDTLIGDPEDHPEFKPFHDAMRVTLWKRAEEYGPYLEPDTNIFAAIAHLGDACEFRLAANPPLQDTEAKFFIRVLLPIEMRLTFVEAMTGFRERLNREAIASAFSRT